MSTSDNGVEMPISLYSRCLPTTHVILGSYPQQTPRHPGAFPEDDPSLYRGELDGLMKQHAQTYQRSRNKVRHICIGLMIVLNLLFIHLISVIYMLITFFLGI